MNAPDRSVWVLTSFACISGLLACVEVVAEWQAI